MFLCIPAQTCCFVHRVLFVFIVSLPYTLANEEHVLSCVFSCNKARNNTISKSTLPVCSSKPVSLGIAAFVICNAIQKTRFELNETKNICLQTGNYTKVELLHIRDISCPILTSMFHQNKIFPRRMVNSA
jgi:hypothetical protein